MKNIYVIILALYSSFLFSQQWTQKNDFPISSISLPSFTINSNTYVIDGIGATLYKYNPDTDTWDASTIDWMVDKGYQNGFALTIGDNVYVAGGFPGDPNDNQKTFYEFDPITETWTRLIDLPNFFSISSFRIPKFSYDNKGYFLIYDKIISFNPATETWEQSITSYPDEPYVFSTAYFSINNKFYIGSGVDSSITESSNFFEYDPETNTWDQIADYPFTPETSFMMSFTLNGKGYTGVGAHAEIGFEYYPQFYEYDPVIDTWTRIPDCGYVTKDAFAFTNNGKGYIGTGWRTSPLEFHNDIWEFDPDDILGTEEYDTIIFTISPNPTQNILHIKSKEQFETVKIYSLQGILIKEGVASSIDVSQLSTGMYFVQVTIDNKTTTKKFIKS